MKKVLSLAFIAAVLLLGCSADGFVDGSIDSKKPENSVSWSKMCKFTVGSNINCQPVDSKAACDKISGILVMRSECP